MKSIVNAKKKNSRRYGQNLWGDQNSPILKRNYAPGNSFYKVRLYRIILKPRK